MKPLLATIVLATMGLAIFSCKSNQNPNSSDMSRNKTSRLSNREFVPGPALDDPKAVRKWIEKLEPLPNKNKCRLRLPIYVLRGSSLSGKPNVYLAGVQGVADAEDRLELRLDDTGLGIPLSDRLRQFCPGEKLECIIQVEGTWGPLLDFHEGEKGPTIALIHVTEFQGDASQGNAAFHIEAEK